MGSQRWLSQVERVPLIRRNRAAGSHPDRAPGSPAREGGGGTGQPCLPLHLPVNRETHVTSRASGCQKAEGCTALEK